MERKSLRRRRDNRDALLATSRGADANCGGLALGPGENSSLCRKDRELERDKATVEDKASATLVPSLAFSDSASGAKLTGVLQHLRDLSYCLIVVTLIDGMSQRTPHLV
jgi:hypothetical protein